MEAVAIWLAFLQQQPPALTDLAFLPPKSVCTHFRQVNSTLVNVLEKERLIRPHLYWELSASLQRCERVQAIWDKIEDAHRTDMDAEFRRSALWQARELLGPERYYAGTVPAIGWARRIGD